MEQILERIRPELTARYDLVQELGRGSNAVVFLAQDRRLGRAVAVKVLLDDLDAVRWRRFEREVELIARLTHPHIVPLHDSGEAAGLPYYVMPRVDGPSLRDRLAAGGQLPLDETIRITTDVASALSYAHGFNVVHRDVKPENILLSSGGALIADFGIARGSPTGDVTTLTHQGMTVGSPAYMSPEQARGEKKLDGRCDLYSLACVVFEMLVGRPPFLSDDPQELLRRQILDPPPTARAARRELPEGVDLVLQRALSKKRGDRQPGAVRFAEDLAFAAGFTGPAGVVPAPRPSLARRVVALLRPFRNFQ